MYSLLEFNAERLEHLKRIVEAEVPSAVSPELLKESEKRLFFLNQRTLSSHSREVSVHFWLLPINKLMIYIYIYA